MIPRKLELKNFLCYGDNLQTIDFNDYNLICLSGKNGYGKSALLDAITWSLWGQARKISGTSKPDSGLLRLGQTRMMVCLECEVNHKIYRVRREYAKTYGKPYAALDFEVYNTNKQKFESLTDKTIRSTQAKIEQTIGLDFETFINTAFLKQGHSNEFSKKTAKERKQVLANILGLNKYDKLQQHALDIVRKKDSEKNIGTKIQEQYQEEVNNLAAIKKSLEQEQKNLKQIQKKLKANSKQLEELVEKEQLMLQQRVLQQECNKKILHLEKDLKQQSEQITSLYKTWKKNHKYLLTVENNKNIEVQKKHIIDQLQKLIQSKQQILVLKEKILQKKTERQEYADSLKKQHDQNAHTVKIELEKKELEKKHLEISHKQQETKIKDINIKIQLFRKDINLKTNLIKQQDKTTVSTEKIKQQFEKRRIFYQLLVQQGNSARKVLNNLENKKNIIEDKKSPSCPLCQQILTAKRKDYLKKQFIEEECFYQHRVKRVADIITKLKNILVQQHKQINIINEENSKKTQLNTQIIELNKQYNAEKKLSEQIEQEIEALKKQLLLTDDEITKNNLALVKLEKDFKEDTKQDKKLVTLNQDIEVLEKQHQANPFDARLLLELQEKLEVLEQKSTTKDTLENKIKEQQTVRNSLSQLCIYIKQIKRDLKEHKLALTKFKTLDKTLEELNTEKKQLADSLTLLTYEKESCIQKIGNCESSIERLNNILSKQKDLKKKILKLSNEVDDYQLLAHTFSKNGIQALLIEEAIPEIEFEANAILGKLSHNQAQVFIESLRDLKSGGVRETLDIKITDELGIRPYELYSGGEAFRIDFALRIAVSKLLARRAGTALQTLIIDEGFGSQDEEGLQLLMNAIHLIQEDFSKIIIVSHLNEFKDNFPIHFVVNKLASGSIVQVEKRG